MMIAFRNSSVSFSFLFLFKKLNDFYKKLSMELECIVNNCNINNIIAYILVYDE